jgi:hypothetical protein
MKKIKIITLIVFLLVLLLVALSFFKLPINTITSATIMEQTNNTVSLTSSEEQTLILLPKPQIEIKEANFSIQNDLLSADLITKNVMFSRSLLDSNNISISIPNASIGNLNINALENEVLLEGEIENLDLNISSNENITEIFSDTFSYKEAEFQFDAFIEDEVLKKLNFSIQELDVNELVLLLDKNHQKFFKQINLDTINVNGEYTQNNFSINNLELNFNENSQLKFSGLINLENFLNSKLNIKGFNIPFEVFSQFLQNINFLNSTKLPKGNLDNFDIEYSDLIKINSLNYITENGSDLNFQGSFNYIDFSDTNFDLNLNSSSSNDISNFFQLIFPKLDSNLISFDKLSLSSNIENENIKIKELNISKDETLISILGDFNLDNFSNRGLQIKINNFKEFDLIPNAEIKEILNQLNISHFTMDGTVIDEEIIINSLDVFEEDELKLSLSGETNLSNTQQTFLNINLQQFDSNDLSKLLKYTDQDDYAKYLDLYSFNNVEGNLIIDLATGNYVLENIEITQDENISTLSGNIFDEKFSGNLSLKNLDLENMEKFFLESSRLKGFLDLNLDISQPIDLKNMIGISGKINGQVKINVKEEEIALLLFMQSLSQDIEDFEQINQLINTLSQSFINNDISIEGEVTNSNNKELIIKDLIFTSSDNQELKGEIEYFHPNYKITIFDIIEQDDFIIKFNKGSYSYERVIPDGTVRKPLEELIQKNINKLFENLLQ